MDEEEYKEKFEKINRKLNDPKISKKIDDYLKKISDLVDCAVELNFNVTPELDEYTEMQESDDYSMPDDDVKTMTLGFFMNSLKKEKNENFKLYLDPIYLNNGVNEIIDLLITTIDDKLILVPISNKKSKK